MVLKRVFINVDFPIPVSPVNDHKFLGRELFSTSAGKTQTPPKANDLILPSRLTYTQNVETKTLRDRFTDQLVRKAVKSNMATQAEVSLLFILRSTRQKIDTWV